MLLVKLIFLIFIVIALGIFLIEFVNYTAYKTIYNKGVDALAEGELKEAEKAFRKVFKLRPKNFKNLYNLGLASFELGKYQKAEEYFLKAINLKLDDMDVYYNLGLLYFNENKKESAVEYFKKALELSQAKDEDTLFNIATAYSDLQDYDMAIQSMSKVVGLKPDSIDYRLSLAEIYEKLIAETGNIQNVDFAIETYKEILEIDNDHEVANIRLAKCYAKVGQIEECKKACQRALGVNTKSHEALYLLGISYMAQQNYEESIQYFEQAYASSSTMKMAYLYAAYGYSKVDKKEQAEDLYMKFKEKSPGFDAQNQVDEYFQALQTA